MENSLSINIQSHDQQQLRINAFGHFAAVSGHKYGPDVRPYYLIHYILKGKGVFVANATHYQLSQGSGFLVEPDYPTIYMADLQDPWTCVWAGFSGTDAGKMASSLGLSQEQPIFKSSEKETLKNCIQGMIDHNRGNAADTFYSLSMLYLFFSTIAASGQEETVSGNCNIYVNQAIAYIRSHISEPLQTDAVARYVGLNRSYLYTLFKQHTGLSPLKYIQKFRLTKAQHLLESSRLSVSAIAYSCGYQQPESLIKIFRQQYGVSPSAYRKLVAAQTGSVSGQTKGGSFLSAIEEASRKIHP